MSSEDSFRTIVSHDFTKKETWYQNSAQNLGETLTLTSGTTYAGTKTHWINLTSGLVFNEDKITTDYAITIYDNGIEVTSGITINHTDGSVTFDSAPTGPVTADYYYATNSEFKLVPDSGMITKIKHAELDFAQNVTMSKIHFEIWAYNPADLPNKVMVEKITYNNMKDIIKVANDMSVVPAVGEITNDIFRVVFRYKKAINLVESSGLELRLKIDNDEAYTGEFGTISLYVIDSPE